VQKAVEEVGGRAAYAFVDADPSKSFERVVSRAGKEGRMVDKLLFAESYVIGAKNFEAFADKHKDNPNAKFVFLSNRQPPPKISPDFPKEARGQTVEAVHASASKYIEETKATMKPHVLEGATASTRIWNANAS
jgi:hypothetical protein